MSSSLKVVSNLDALMETLRDVYAGNWSASGKVLREAKRDAKREAKKAGSGGNVSHGAVAKVREMEGLAPLAKVVHNVSLEAAVKAARHSLTRSVRTGAIQCPRVRKHRLLERPLYPLFAQIHRNRLGAMLLRTDVLASLSLICIIGSQVSK